MNYTNKQKIVFSILFSNIILFSSWQAVSFHQLIEYQRLSELFSDLKNGKSPNEVDSNGITALHCIAGKTYDGDFQSTTVEINGELVSFAARAKGLGVMKALLDANANIDAQDAKGDTPLHIATRSGNADYVSFLLARDANLIPNNAGCDPFAELKKDNPIYKQFQIFFDQKEDKISRNHKELTGLLEGAYGVSPKNAEMTAMENEIQRARIDADKKKIQSEEDRKFRFKVIVALAAVSGASVGLSVCFDEHPRWVLGSEGTLTGFFSDTFYSLNKVKPEDYSFLQRIVDLTFNCSDMADVIDEYEAIISATASGFAIHRLMPERERR